MVCTLLFLTVVPLPALAQTLSDELGDLPIQTFEKPFEMAATQSWDAIADPQGVMYFGNRQGILEFDGVRWREIVTPEVRVVFSLAKRADGTIYAGGDNLIGRLRVDSTGSRVFQSLNHLLPDDVPSPGEFRWAVAAGDQVYLQSNRLLLRTDGRQARSWTAADDDPFLGLFDADDAVYVLRSTGLFRVRGDAFTRVSLPASVDADQIRVLIALPEGLLLGTREGGLMLLDASGRLSAFAPDATPYLSEHRVRTGTRLSNGMIAIGTLAGGTVLLTAEGMVVSVLSSSSGMADVTIHGLYEDVHNGLWMVGDRGISRAEIPPGRSQFGERRGLLGSGQSVIRYNGLLYVSTLRGVFVLEASARSLDGARFRPIPRLERSCFEFLPTSDGLLVACEGGVFQIAGASVRHVLAASPAITLLRLKSDPSLVLVGLTDGLAFLRRTGDGWTPLGRVDNFYGFVRHTVEDADAAIWIATRGPGLHRLHLNVEEPSASTLSVLGPENGLPEGRLRAYLLDGGLLVASNVGLYVPGENGRFVRDTRFDAVLNEETSYPIRLLAPNEHEIWVSLPSGVRRIARTQPEWNLGPVLARENGLNYGMYVDADGTLWSTGTHGLVRYDRSSTARPVHPPRARIRQVTALSERTTLYGGVGVPSLPPFDPGFGGLRVSFGSLREVTGTEIQYQTRLNDRPWSVWTDETFRDFADLRGGTYTLSVRARGTDGVPGPTDSLRFTVLPRWYEAWWALVLGVAGLIGVLIVGVKWRTGRLERRTEELERVVAERTSELAARKDELQHSNQLLHEQKAEIERQATVLAELDELKSRFFANISHEFRTPLTLILGPTEDVLNGEYGPVHDRVRRRLEMVLRNGHRLQRLVNQLLDLSRAEAGNLQLSRRAVNVTRFVERTVRAFKPLAERRRVRLDVEIPDRNVIASIDPDQMEKILVNLLSNAFKATEEDGLIRITFSADEARMWITVTDDGVGIEADHLPYIFDRFRQFHRGRWNAQPGSGIGLNLVRELVALHGGTIDVESTHGEGTCFTVRIPRVVPDASVTAEDEAGEVVPIEPGVAVEEPSPPDDDRTTILVVDDEADVRHLIRDRLASVYRVIEADDGITGLDAARKHLPDLIVSDVMMPRRDGVDFCRDVKSDAELGHVPVILLTARAGRESRLGGLGAGADDYLTKPFDADELRARIQNLIALRQSLRDRFASEVTVRPTDVRATSADAAFLERVRDEVEAHLTVPEYTVDALAEGVGVSTSQLQRRLRALLDETPNQLIRRMRLERAANLIEQQAGTMSEIAYACGFNSQAYFTRAFKEYYGQTPTSYRRAHTAQETPT